MRKLLSFILLLVVFYGTYKLYRYQSGTALSSPVRIGVTLPLSGKASKAGLAAQDAINMALKEWSGRNNKYKYQIFYLDDFASAEQAANNAETLIKNQKTDVILSMWTPAAQMISQLASKYKIIHFTCASDKKISDGKFNFNHYLSYHTDKFTADFYEDTGRIPASCTSNLYDALNLLIFAYENTAPGRQGKNPAGEEISRSLHKLTNHQTVSGAVRISPEGIVLPVE